MLSVDYTLFIQIANFLILLILLNIFLFRPIRNILTKRQEETSTLEKTIEDLKGRSNEREKGIESGLVQARKEGYAEKESFKGQGMEEEKGILKETSSSVEEKINQAREDIEKRMLNVSKELEAQVSAFSRELAEKILGRTVQ